MATHIQMIVLRLQAKEFHLQQMYMMIFSVLRVCNGVSAIIKLDTRFPIGRWPIFPKI